MGNDEFIDRVVAYDEALCAGLGADLPDALDDEQLAGTFRCVELLNGLWGAGSLERDHGC